MKITIKDVEYAAKLARLELTGGEKERYAKQLDAILDYMDELNKVDTAGIQPTSHAFKMQNVFRDDKIKKSGVSDDIISNAPEKENRFFKVRKVIK